MSIFFKVDKHRDGNVEYLNRCATLDSLVVSLKNFLQNCYLFMFFCLFVRCLWKEILKIFRLQECVATYGLQDFLKAINKFHIENY